MAETAIEIPNLQDAASKLRDKIHLAFAEIIPPEQWQKLIEAELQKFLKPSETKDQWNNWRKEPALLERICQEEFSKHARKLVSEALSKPEYQGAAYEGEVSATVQKWLTDNAQKLIQATILELAGNAAESLLSRMRND